uniref:CCHC-type domain-containing protein n=3 Tax=Caenorhabditis japonica TaxID=281687 RepID=A0A8R1EQA9_CAEJA
MEIKGRNTRRDKQPKIKVAENQRKIDMSVRQAEKDVELEVGHVEEKNVVVEVVEWVTGGESEERLGVERKSASEAEENCEKVEKDLVVMTKCTKRQREGIIGPLKEFASELLERFEEMGADRWPRSVLHVIKAFDLENVQDIRKICKKALGEECSETNESTDAEKLEKVDRKYKKLKNKLSEFQIRKAYPGVDDENLSQMRTTKLMMAVKDNENLHNLLIMKRLDYTIEDQYENLKYVVLQQEQEKRQARKKGHSFLMNEGKMRKDTPWKKSDYHLNQFKNEQKDEMGFRKEENQSQPDLKCFRCGGVGHMSRQCTSKPLYVVEKKNSEESEGVGAEVVETVENLGQNRKIIIDSGAVVSVMSSATWKRLKKGCPDWEKRVEELAKPGFTILNASKAEMPVEKQLKMEVRVRGKKASVVFQLVVNSSEILLLGINAFKSVGVELKWKAKNAVARAAEKLRVPPQSCSQNEVIVEVDMGKTVWLESNKEWKPASLCSKNDEGNITVSVSNWRNEPVLIKKNQIVGMVSREWKVCERKEEKVVKMLDIDKKPSLKREWRKKKVGRLLNETGEIPSGMFRRSISEFSEVFAIEDSELTQTGIVECKVELEKDNPIHKIKYPGVGDRVRIRIPAEKLRSKNPKLANEWQGAISGVENTVNSAEMAPIIG